MASKYFGTPFANSGDKSNVPDASQPSGDVSMEEGWTPDYAKDQTTDANAKDVSRQSENYLKNIITEALKEIQEIGFKVYDPFVNYPVGAFTPGSDGNLYKALIKNGPGVGFTPVVDPVGNPLTWEDLSLKEVKSWINFNGGGGVSIRDSLNVSSIIDNGIGDYTINFINPMSDANYAIVGSTGVNDLYQMTIISQTTLSFNIKITQTNASGVFDQSIICISVFGS